MPEPDVLILYSPKHDKTLIKSNSSLYTAHLVVDKPALVFHLQLSLRFLEHFSSFGRKCSSCFCIVSGVLAEGTPLWKHAACLGARQAKACRLLRRSLHAHPPQQSSGFLHCHLHSLLKSSLLILAHFSKWLHTLNPTHSTDDLQSHILSGGGVGWGQTSVVWRKTRLGMGFLTSTPCLFSLCTQRA